MGVRLGIWGVLDWLDTGFWGFDLIFMVCSVVVQSLGRQNLLSFNR